MKISKFIVLTAILFSMSSAGGQEKTILCSEIYGYKQDLIYYDCLQSPAITSEFHNNPGEQFPYTFTTTFSPIIMLINGKTEVLMNSGDSIHVVIHQEGKNIRANYSGTEKTVAANMMRQELRQECRLLNYKTQLLSCVALDIKPKKRIDDARLLLKKIDLLKEKYKSQADLKLLDYVSAEQEASSYMSMMEYPKMYEEVRRQKIDQQEIGNYWAIMDGIKLRDDISAMTCPEYASFLLRYCFYENEKKAVNAGSSYSPPQTLETMFDEVKTFYSGSHRDFALYTLLCNFIRNGKEIDRSLPLYKEYKERYNKNKSYTEVLDRLLQ